MNKQNRERPIRKILVALDASAHSTAALEASIELAASLGAEVTGLFIEDITLLRLAEFPFVREVSFFTPSLRRIELAQLERQLRAQANRMRNLLSDYASRAGISWHFRVVRGAVASEVMAAAAETDLIVLGKRGRSMVRQMGSTARFIISEGRGMMLILEHGYRLDMPVTVFYDGTELSDKALEAAVHLVKVKDDCLTVFVLALEKEYALQIQAAAMKHLGRHGLAANFRVVFNPTASKLLHLIRMEGGGPVVLHLGAGPLQDEELSGLISEISNPVLLIR
jgi:nucleotide-binding universal stress UspA family protein